MTEFVTLDQLSEATSSMKAQHSLRQQPPGSHNPLSPCRIPHFLYILEFPNIAVAYTRYFALGAFHGEFDLGQGDRFCRRLQPCSTMYC